MKRIFTILMLAVVFMQTKAQIIITGVMYDPGGSDAPAENSVSHGLTHKGGYEYIQFMATEDIDFSVTPYSVVICKNTSSLGAVDPAKAWAVGGDRSYKFNLTSGTAAKGTFFYVGGPEKTIAGYVYHSTNVNPGVRTLDISSSNWIRVIPYGSSAFDDFGNSTSGLFPNGEANPFGIGVFEGINVTGTSAPIDAIFVATANPIGATATTYSSGGYKVPDNDHYESSAYFGSSTKNKFAFLYQNATSIGLSADYGNFLKLGGKYDPHTKTWIEARTTTYVALIPNKDNAGAANFATLAMIESDGVTTLPIELSSFSAKKDNGTVNLYWSTASEKNNDYFKLLRSIDGKNFNEIGRLNGAGTKNDASYYQFSDKKPIAGTNYYKLVQVDFDGKSSESKVVFATFNFNDAVLSVSSNGGTVLAKLNTPVGGNGTIILSDIQGRKIKTLNKSISIGVNEISFDVVLSPGVYVLTFQMNSQLASKFVVK